MSDRENKLKISFNAPAVLTFAAICFVVQIVNTLTHNALNGAVTSVYRTSLIDPLMFVRAFTHVVGHGNWDHLLNNMMYILILGPMLEEKYGTSNIVFVMVATALVTGIAHLLFFPATRLLGASGIVFAMILLSSITMKGGKEIPATFILVALLYIGQQVYQAVTKQDNISQLTHILGGLVGSGLGFTMNRLKMNHYQR